nr:hypothetical protein [Tanacetum cinerariifolium]
MERGFMSSNSKTKNKHHDKNDKQSMPMDDEVKNDLASRIKNIDGKSLGRKAKSILKRVSNEGSAATNDDCTNGLPGSILCDVTVLNQAPDACKRSCEDHNGLSQVEDQGGSTIQKKTIKIMELHNEEVVEGAAVAILSSNVKSTSDTTKDRDMPSPSCARTYLNTLVSNPFDVLSTTEDTCGPSVQNPKVSEPIGSGILKLDDIKAPKEESL